MVGNDKDTSIPLRVGLLREIDTFLAKHPEITPEAFGWAACKNSLLVARLRSGGDIRTAVWDKVFHYLHNNPWSNPNVLEKEND